MALNDPNVQVAQSNISLSPQLGTFATLDTSNPSNSRLLLKNNTGALVRSFDCSTNLTVDVTALEYVSARNQTFAFDGATFFTLQHYSSTRAVIRRWSLDPDVSTLSLEDTIIKDSGPVYKYDSNAFAVEHYQRSFAFDASSDNKLRINNFSKIQSGDELLLGPSSDTDNPGETELLTVDYTDFDGSFYWVYFTSNFNNDYVSGDPISFYKYIYIFTNDHTTDGRGAIYKLNPTTGAEIEYDVGQEYQNVTAAAWNDFYTLPSFARYNQLIHVNHTIGYSIYRSHDLWLNIESDHVTVIPVEDLYFDNSGAGAEIGKLQQKITLQNDSGVLTTTTWSDYNIHEDIALQYTNNLSLWIDGDTEAQRALLFKNETVGIEARVISQYGFPLTGKTVQFFRSGDPEGSFNPSDGQVTTDVDGYARITYTTGVNASGNINVSARTDGADANSGGAYAWGFIELFVIEDYEHESYQIKQIADTYSSQAHMVKQLSPTFAHNNTSNFGHIRQLKTLDDRKRVRQLASVSSEKPLQQWFASGDGGGLGYPAVYPHVTSAGLSEDDDPQFIRTRQIEEFVSTRFFSQLYQAHHESSQLSTTESIDQFFFVLEAIPPWYSEKNPIVQTIYLRISPFAFDLNQSTFNILVKNDWTRGGNFYTTGWKNVTGDSTITTFGSPLGLEINYNPAPDTWEYDSRVYVRFYVYDTDPSGANLMDVTYWFDIIPDFRGPTISNHSPARFSSNIDVDTNISFDVTEDGVGVDSDATELVIEGALVSPVTITTISGGYHYEYNPPKDFFYDQEVSITIDVFDLNGNNTHETYYFNTGESQGPWYHGAYPIKCTEGVVHDTKVELQVYALDHGIDTTTILVKIDRKNREFVMYPIVYRLS